MADVTAFVCSVCGETFASRAATPRHRCRGDYVGRFGVPLRDATHHNSPPTPSEPYVSRDTRPTTPEAIEGDVAFEVEDDDGTEAETIEPRLGAGEDYVEPKKVDAPTSRRTVIRLATYIEALEHGLGMTTLSPRELKRVKSELAGSAADIHIETAEIVVGAGASLVLSAGLLGLIYSRDLMGPIMGNMGDIIDTLGLRPEAPPDPPDEWAEGGD